MQPRDELTGAKLGDREASMPRVAARALGEPARGDFSCTAALVWHEGFQQSPAACSIPVVREPPPPAPPWGAGGNLARLASTEEKG